MPTLTTRIRHETISLRAMARVFHFSDLATADLFIDAIYEGGTKGNTADDVPLNASTQSRPRNSLIATCCWAFSIAMAAAKKRA